MRISDWSSDVCSSDLLFDDLLAAISEGVNDAIGQQNAQEGANERRSDHRAQDFRRLVDGAHRLDHAKDGRDDAKGRQGVGQALKIMGWADCFVMVGRSEERRVGEEWVSKCRYRCGP